MVQAKENDAWSRKMTLHRGEVEGILGIWVGSKSIAFLP